MRLRSVIFLQALALGGCAHEAREEGRAPAPPRIVFDATQHDFGRVEQGTRVHHVFRFANQGEQDLSINDLRSGCGCAAAVPGKKVVPPGSEGAIEVDLDTEQAFGPQRRTVTVYANDPEALFTMLVLTGEVALDVAADPAQLYVGQLHAGERFWREVTVLVGDGVEVLAVESGGPRLGVVSNALDDGRHGRRIQVSVASDAAPGPLEETVLVRTSSGRRPVLRIPVVGRVEERR